MAAPVEKKVTAGAVATYLASTGLLAILAAAKDNAELVGFLPDGIAPFVLAIVPTAIAFVSGWAAKHSPRIHA
jgi:hypothetical protein